MIDSISQRITQAITEQVFPGCVVGIVRRNGERTVLPFGYFTYDETASRVQEDSIYDIASITKSIPTGCLALQLIEEGKLKLDDKLIEYVPGFRNSDREHVLIRHLLTYALDGYGIASLGGTKKSAADIYEILFTHDFEKRPGTVFKYSNIPTMLLGLVIEAITGQALDTLAQERFFDPLCMVRTTYHPERFSKDEIAPTEIDDWRGLVHGIVHDDSANIIYRERETIMGHAGLFSTAPDILQFLEMLLNEGMLKGQRFFYPEMVAQMGTNQIAELGDYTGLGWELNQPRFMGTHCGSHTFGKTGFTGTLCVVDVAREIAYVMLANRTFPRRAADSKAINAVRADIGGIILASQF